VEVGDRAGAVLAAAAKGVEALAVVARVEVGDRAGAVLAAAAAWAVAAKVVEGAAVKVVAA
jgi:hypothetical protein